MIIILAGLLLWKNLESLIDNRMGHFLYHHLIWILYKKLFLLQIFQDFIEQNKLLIYLVLQLSYLQLNWFFFTHFQINLIKGD